MLKPVHQYPPDVVVCDTCHGTGATYTPLIDACKACIDRANNYCDFQDDFTPDVKSLKDERAE